MNITKRNGKQVDYDENRIIIAMEKAMKETAIGVDSDISKTIARKISNQLNLENKDKTVEEIQDMVELELENIRPDVAEKYKSYRQHRHEIRSKRLDLYKIATEIIDVSDYEMSRENANLNGESFSGKFAKFGSELSKWYTKAFKISKTVEDAIRNNDVYVHDLDQYCLGTTNCIFIPFDKLLKSGFNTGNGYIRPPKSISTAMALVAIIFQSQQNAQYGGVSGNKIDWDLAPYVQISFRKNFKKAMRFHESEINIPDKDLYIDNMDLKNNYPKLYKFALQDTEDENKSIC